MDRVRPFSLHIFCAVALMIAAGPSAMAGCFSYTYTFTGGNFTSIEGDTTLDGTVPALTTADFTSGSFTFAKPLPDNLNAADETNSPELLGYTVSDGVTTVSAYGDYLLEAPLFELILSTNASGDVTTGDFGANYNGYGCSTCIFVADDYVAFIFNTALVGQAEASGGAWSYAATPTPEPDSFYLFGFGLALLAAWRFIRVHQESSKRD